MLTYRLTRRARRDVLDIWKYIAEASEVSADKFIDQLLRNFRILGDFPRAGRRRDELRRGYRSFPVDEYVILYRLMKFGVTVMRVIHGRRDIQALFGD